MPSGKRPAPIHFKWTPKLKRDFHQLVLDNDRTWNDDLYEKFYIYANTHDNWKLLATSGHMNVFLHHHVPYIKKDIYDDMIFRPDLGITPL